MINKDSYFDKETFNILKGSAVILLFVHHFFTFPEFYLPEYLYPGLYFYEKYFQFSTNMCVAIFAFLTGYGIYFSNHKGFRSFLFKAKKVLTIYWFIFLTLLFCAVVFVNYRINARQMMLEFLGFSEISLNGDIIIFFWYMPFYLTILFLLSVCFPLQRCFMFILTDIFFVIIMPVFLFSFLGNLSQNCFCLKRFFVDLMLWFPCVMMGSISAKYALLQRLDSFFELFYKKSVISLFLIPVVFVAFVFYGMYKMPGRIFYLQSSLFLPIVFNMSVCYVLFLIYAIIKLFKLINIEITHCIVAEFGRLSLYMWLIHGLFFNVFKNYTQPILFLPKFPVLILAWGLFICYLLSKFFEALINGVYSIIYS